MNLDYEIAIHDPVVVYQLKGKIISDSDYEELRREVFDHMNQNYYRVVFDLEELSHINSMGIGFFMRTLTKARIMNGELVLVNINGNVKKIFEIAKLDEVYTISEDLESGIAYFNT